MPDISLCPGTSCNLKENCYRYKATPKPYWQSYFTSAPLEEDGTCKYFWDYKEELRNSYDPYESCESYESIKDKDA